ncbi:MAG: type IIL restriction-modification enzyme MmeI, partial [Paracraurococcus sp.]
MPYQDIYVEAATHPLTGLHPMVNGNKPADGGNLLMGFNDAEELRQSDNRASDFLRRFVGAEDSIQGKLRFCLWISGGSSAEAEAIPAIAARIASVRRMRLASDKELTKRGASSAHAFQQVRQR